MTRRSRRCRRLARPIHVGRTVLCAIAAASLGGCGPAELPATPAASPRLLVALAHLPIDLSSRELLSLIDGSEVVEATISTPAMDDLTVAARGAGLDATAVEPDTVVIEGPLDRIVAVVAGGPTKLIYVEEIRRAERPIPVEQPIVNVPVSGRPYLRGGIGDDPQGVTMSAAQRDPMLQSLAAAIQTIDGRPYGQLQLEGNCGDEAGTLTCRMTATGRTVGAIGGHDSWSVHGTEATGWSGIVDRRNADLTSVPRPILRSAEWIARHDPAAAAAIRRYATCCTASWDPLAPGKIRLEFLRPCPGAVGRPGEQVADQGECLDWLGIVVDIAAATIVDITERPGP